MRMADDIVTARERKLRLCRVVKINKMREALKGGLTRLGGSRWINIISGAANL